MTKSLLSLVVAGAISIVPILAGPVLAQTKPYAGQSITVLLPPWGTLPKDMTDRFTAETGIALDMQTLGWDEIRTKIVTSELAGTAPADVTEVDWSWVGQFGAAGWYEPLDAVVSASLRKDAPTDKIFTYDGKLVAMPYNNDYRILIVNAAKAGQAGISAAPKTLDELTADARAVKAKGVVAFPIGLPLSATEGTATAWYLLTKAFGGELFDKDFKPSSPTRTRPAIGRSPGRRMR
jgi:multiple sugar transport system substrate-binding protein